MKKFNLDPKIIFVSVVLLIISILFVISYITKGSFDFKCIKRTSDNICREEYIIRILSNFGPKRAFEEIEKFKNTVPSFADDCHSVAHDVGIAAYPLLLQGKNVFSMPISSCEYGYIHGLMMETSMHQDDINFARNYCIKIGKISGGNPDVIFQCFHGIGHGISLRLASYGMTDPLKITEESFKICNESPDPSAECQGIYGGIAYLFTGTHGIKFKNTSASEVFAYCDSQPSGSVGPCYKMMSPALVQILDNDVAEAVKLSNINIPLQKDKNIAATTLGMEILTSENRPGLAQVVHICRQFSGEADYHCIEGYMQAFTDAAVITDLNRDVLSFCDQSILNKDEYLYCRKGVLENAISDIGSQNFQSVCKTLSIDEQNTYCSK